MVYREENRTMRFRDYKKEMTAMKRHRTSYAPTLKAMERRYRGTPAENLPLNLTDEVDITVILELLDIGYLDPDAFVVTKKFGHIERVSYIGQDPLADRGRALLRDSEIVKARRRFAASALALGAMALVLVLMIC
jgi:hypothetical protein